MLGTAINFKSGNANVNAIAVLRVGGNYEIIDFVVIIAKFWTNYCDSSLHRPKYTENKTNRVRSVKSDRRLVGWLVGRAMRLVVGARVDGWTDGRRDAPFAMGRPYAWRRGAGASARRRKRGDGDDDDDEPGPVMRRFTELARAHRSAEMVRAAAAVAAAANATSDEREETRRVRVERTPNGESVVVMDDAKEGDDGDDTAAKKT